MRLLVPVHGLIGPCEQGVQIRTVVGVNSHANAEGNGHGNSFVGQALREFTAGVFQGFQRLSRIILFGQYENEFVAAYAARMCGRGANLAIVAAKCCNTRSPALCP